jgi:plastocyanin
MATFIVAVGVSMGYYQFVYIPQANAKPILPDAYLHPPAKTQVTIVKGASQQSSPQHFFPQSVQVQIGTANEVIWTNKDVVPHTVTSDSPAYVDRINGPFDTTQQTDNVPGGYILPGKTFDFTFTAVGSYPYHCIPHPFMQGTVTVVPRE